MLLVPEGTDQRLSCLVCSRGLADTGSADGAITPGALLSPLEVGNLST
jgi:hypothetical protein